MATTIGAIVGRTDRRDDQQAHHQRVRLHRRALSWSAISSLRETKHAGPQKSADPLAVRLRLNSTYSKDGPAAYGVRYPRGLLVMFGRGRSPLVGVGLGVVKVIAMDRLMRLPSRSRPRRATS